MLTTTSGGAAAAAVASSSGPVQSVSRSGERCGAWEDLPVIDAMLFHYISDASLVCGGDDKLCRVRATLS